MKNKGTVVIDGEEISLNHQVRIEGPFEGGAWTVEVDREGKGCISCVSFDSLTAANLAAFTAAEYYDCEIKNGGEVLK